MRILIFNWRDIKNPDAGGAEVNTHENSRRWVKWGNEVTLFSPEFKNCKKQEVIDGVKIIRAGGKYSVYWAAKKYYNKYFKGKFDIVIDEINTRPFLTPNFVKDAKIIAFIHQLAREYWFYETPFPISYLGYYWLEKNWLKNYVDIPTVAVSDSTRQDLISLGFKKVFVVFTHGILFKPVQKIPNKEKNPTIIHVGRLKKAKRPDHVIKAFKAIKQKIPNSNLWIVGDGYFKKELERNSFEGVKFFGYVDEKTKRELIKKSWVLVNPSIREGFSLSIIEANAMGTPAVAYDVPGLRDSIINGKTGLLAKNGDVDSLSDSIFRILGDKELREKLGVKGLEWSKTFTWDRSAKDFFEVIKKVVDEE